MKSRHNVKVYLWINASVLLILIFFRGYIHFFEGKFNSLNYNNIKEIQEMSKNKEEISFAVLGNMKSSIEVFDKQIVDMINNDDVDFIISTGNSIANGSENKYRFLNKTLNKLKIPYVGAVGEREITDKGAIRFYKHFGPLYFSFAAGNSYYIFIDTTKETSKLWQKEWLLKELKESSKYTNRFVFMNKPPYKPDQIEESKVKDGYVADERYRQFLIDAFSEYKVSAVFSSNIGIYDEKTIKGVPYYISGGGGGPLFSDRKNSFYHYIKIELSPDKISYEVKKMDASKKLGWWAYLSSRWLYFYSLFRINLVHFLIGIGILSMSILLIYNKATGEVSYYKDFDGLSEDTEQNPKLNIAMFTNNYFPFVGGVPISIERLSRGLRKQGHNVYIFAPEYPQEYKDDTDSVVRCKLITYYETDQFDFPIVNVFLPEIEKEFASRNIDIVHIHHPFGIGQKALKLARKYNLPAVLTYHTRYEKYAHNLPVGSELFKSSIPHKIIRKFAQKCDGIIAPTQSAKEYLEHIGVTKPIEVLPTGIELDQYEKVEPIQVESIRNQYIRSEEVLLCSVSRITKEKNLYFLIDGIKYVKAKCEKDFKCIIIGDGPEKDNLQEVIDRYHLTDTILLIGKVKPEAIRAYYRASDIFVFASKSETQGMVLLEAMVGGCPIVAVRSSGTDDMIMDEENGYKTQSDIEAWGKKVIELIENETLRNLMSKNAYDFAKGFSIDEMAKKASRTYYCAITTKETELSFGETISE